MKIKVRGKGFAFRDKYLAALTVLFLSFNFCQGQVLQRDPSYGRHWYRGAFDSVLVIPKDTARIRLVETGLDTGQIRYNRTDSSVYIYTGSGWRKIGGSGGGGSQGFEDVLNVDPDLTTYHTINATDTFRINIGKSYFSMTDSVLILYQERQDGSIRYLQISPEGIKNLITNLPGDAGQEIFTIANADSKAKKTFVNTDIVYPNADSSDASTTDILWVDRADGNKIKKGALSLAGGGLNYSDTGRAPTNLATGGALNNVRDSLQANINLKVNIADTASMLADYLKKLSFIDSIRNYFGGSHLAADFTTSSTTAVSTNLSFTASANSIYRVTISGTASKATSSTGLKLAIDAPAGSTIKGVQYGGQASLSTALQNSLISTISTLGGTFATGTGVEVPFRMEFILETSSTAGAVTLQGATVTSNTATIYARTSMFWTKSVAQ